jgi:D-ribose pyranase
MDRAEVGGEGASLATIWIRYFVFTRRPMRYGLALSPEARRGRRRKIKTMLQNGILNPQLLALLARVRHTNTLVIADRGFPFWPQIETVDISLVDNVPTVLDVLRALRPNFVIGKAWMAQEFLRANDKKTQAAFAVALNGIPLVHEPHVDFKRRVPHAIGLIRTGDTVQYANVILESA